MANQVQNVLVYDRHTNQCHYVGEYYITLKVIDTKTKQDVCYYNG